MSDCPISVLRQRQADPSIKEKVVSMVERRPSTKGSPRLQVYFYYHDFCNGFRTIEDVNRSPSPDTILRRFREAKTDWEKERDPFWNKKLNGWSFNNPFLPTVGTQAKQAKRERVLREDYAGRNKFFEERQLNLSGYCDGSLV